MLQGCTSGLVKNGREIDLREAGHVDRFFSTGCQVANDRFEATVSERAVDESAAVRAGRGLPVIHAAVGDVFVFPVAGAVFEKFENAAGLADSSDEKHAAGRGVDMTLPVLPAPDDCLFITTADFAVVYGEAFAGNP